MLPESDYHNRFDNLIESYLGDTASNELLQYVFMVWKQYQTSQFLVLCRVDKEKWGELVGKGSLAIKLVARVPFIDFFNTCPMSEVLADHPRSSKSRIVVIRVYHLVS